MGIINLLLAKKINGLNYKNNIGHKAQAALEYLLIFAIITAVVLGGFGYYYNTVRRKAEEYYQKRVLNQFTFNRLTDELGSMAGNLLSMVWMALNPASAYHSGRNDYDNNQPQPTYQDLTGGDDPIFSPVKYGGMNQEEGQAELQRIFGGNLNYDDPNPWNLGYWSPGELIRKAVNGLIETFIIDPLNLPPEIELLAKICLDSDMVDSYAGDLMNNWSEALLRPYTQ